MLKTDGIITIKTACDSDVDILVDWWSRGEVMAHAGFPKGIKALYSKEDRTTSLAW